MPKVKRQKEKTLHSLLHKLVVHLPTDFEPYGQRERDGPDCSCGCKHFLKLRGDLGFDWGVCSNPKSPRGGMLTFEHQGRDKFKYGPALDKEDWAKA
jgi:hypothetical protein